MHTANDASGVLLNRLRELLVLKERVLTALVLVPMVIWCVFFAGDPRVFAIFSGLIVAVAGWEWAALMGWKAPAARLALAAVVVTCLLALQLPLLAAVKLPLYGLSLLFWLLALRMVRGYPASASLWAKNAVLLPVGFILLVPAWSGLVDLHRVSPWWLLYLFGLVWGADTGAYFAGRAFGKHKLAPAVSPGKTVEGLAGGLALTGALMVGVGLNRGLSGSHFLAFLGLSFLTVLASVLGDLLESMAKRQAGVKDSGSIFPGHGGALDRIDSLTAAAPVFMLGWLVGGGF
jgi:phosphatidate cytidylyltransferase